jgi:hypothetical protein
VKTSEGELPSEVFVFEVDNVYRVDDDADTAADRGVGSRKRAIKDADPDNHQQLLEL